MLLIGCKSKGTRVQEQLDLGAKYMEDLDYESAIVALNKAIQIDPKNVEAYTMLAELYEKSGRVDEARETLEMALDIAGLSSKKEEEINKRLKNLEFLVMISETPGEYDEPKSIELRNENDYDIYYTIETKENRLVATDLKYTEPILLDEDGKYILKAYTVDDDNEKHNEIVVKYTLKLAKEHTEKDSWENVGDIYRYRGKDGKIVTGWLEIDGDRYYFTDKGNMATGPQDIDGKQYYFGEDGVMLTGWQQINGKWYYLGEDGVIKSGPQSIDGKWYYFGEDGTMETGWKQIGDKWYYLLDTGEFSIGWQNIGGKWYYFASNGEMKTDQYIDGYYIGADGVMTEIVQEPVPPSKKYTDQFRYEKYSQRIDDYGEYYEFDSFVYNDRSIQTIFARGPVIDRGSYYEIQNATFYGERHEHYGGFDQDEVFTTTVYLRKNAIVTLHSLYDGEKQKKTAEQCFNDYGGRFWNTDDHEYDTDIVLSTNGYYIMDFFDKDGYLIKLDDIQMHAE